MPFKSEKQRRFLWATHPEIAKRWAHKYPKSNKDLPMYASDNDADKKAALAALAHSLKVNSGKKEVVNADPSILGTVGNFAKVSADGLVYVKLPKKSGPTYAGEEQEQGTTPGASKNNAENSENSALDEKNPVAQKLAVVLGPKLREVMEQQMAAEQNRQALPVPQNLGLKRYAVNPAAQVMPPGFGAAQPGAQPQQPNQGPVGGGSNPATNPINAYGPLSQSGVINGNAAFGQKNSPDSMKFAGLFDFLKRKPADDWAPPAAPKYDIEDENSDWDVYEKNRAKFEKDLRQYLKTKGYSKIQPHHYEPGGTPWSMLGQNGKYHEIWMPEDGEPVAKPTLLEDMYDADTPDKAYRKSPGLVLAQKHAAANTPCSCNCGDTVSTCKCGPDCKCRQPGGSCYKAEKQANGGSKPWHNSLANQQALRDGRILVDAQGKGYYPHGAPVGNLLDVAHDDGHKGWHEDAREWFDPESPKAKSPEVQALLTRLKRLQDYQEPVMLRPSLMGRLFKGHKPYDLRDILKKTASSPAWQRSEGKNPEGGLNEKGRKSYERETGGNLKAPVTESNPSGERAKRQNSFCARMCGMKRVNTGASTAKDPDSRINKSLSKWNCKCGSAFEFGQRIKEAVGWMDHASNFADGLGTSFNNASRAFKGMTGTLAGGLTTAGAGAAGLGMQGANLVGGVFGKQPFSNEAVNTAYGVAQDGINTANAYAGDFAQSMGLGEHGLAGTTMNTPSRGDAYIRSVQQRPGVDQATRNVSNAGLAAADFAAKAAPVAAIGSVAKGVQAATQGTRMAPVVAPATKAVQTLNSTSNPVGAGVGAGINAARALQSQVPPPMPQLAKAGAAGLIDIIVKHL